jgi:hypothetical protein
MMLLTRQPNILSYTNRISNLYVTMLSIQQPLTLYVNQGDRPPAAEGPLPMRIPGAARRMPSQLSKTMTLYYHIVFSVFVISCYLISATPKTHKPQNAHRMYPRYPRVFLYMFNIYCPLPHQSLWERLGVPLLCTCAAFGKLIFSKNNLKLNNMITETRWKSWLKR